MNVDLKQERAESNRSTSSGGAPHVVESGKKESYPVNSETRILNMLKEGDQEGLRMIMQKHHDKLLSVAKRICNNPADAEEVLQDVYMIALQKIDKFEERSTLSTWLYRITVNAALMKLRTQRVAKSTISIDGLSSLLGENENALRFDEEVRSPDEALLTKELYSQINDSVEDLPEIYQSVFLLRDVQGYSIKETSKMLHTTPAAVKSRLHRSRFFLKGKLGHYLNKS